MDNLWNAPPEDLNPKSLEDLSDEKMKSMASNGHLKLIIDVTHTVFLKVSFNLSHA